MAKKTNCTKGGRPYFRIKRKVGRKLNKDGCWVDKYKEFYGSSEKEAKNKYAAYLKSVSSAFTNNQCLGELIDTWVDTTFKNSNLAEGTKKLYENIYRNNFRSCDLASWQINDIDSMMLQKYFNESDMKYSTKIHLLAFLKRFFKYADVTNLSQFNIAASIEILRPEDNCIAEYKPVEIWNMRDVKKVISCTEGTYLRFIVVLAVNTGLRIGEILALDYEDITHGQVYVTKQVMCDNGSIHLTKTKSRCSVRTIPVSDYVLGELEKHKKLHRKDMAENGYITNHIFTTNTGNYLDRHNVTRYLDRIYKANNIERHKFHCFRHTYGTNLANSGYSLEETAALMGHASAETTRKYYIHISEDRKKNSAKAISELCV